jgi:ABC-type transport system involved in cytochrome c biogenesis permease component
MPRFNEQPKGKLAALFWDLLTFEKLMTSTVIHLIYWAGLGLISLGAFGTIGAAIGVALREPSLMSVLIAIPVLVGGLLFAAVLILLWRSFCEFYVAVFRISDDLHALRQVTDAEQQRASAPRR